MSLFFFLLVELFKSEQRLPFFRIRGFIFFGGKKKNVKILKIRGFENSLTPGTMWTDICPEHICFFSKNDSARNLIFSTNIMSSLQRHYKVNNNRLQLICMYFCSKWAIHTKWFMKIISSFPLNFRYMLFFFFLRII